MKRASPTFEKAARLPLALLRKAHDALVWVWLLPVRFYRRFISPLKPGGGSCRFTPTCSRYAVEAVLEWGILCGTALAIWRVLRCNPFSKGGEDPVPKRREAAARLRSLFRARRNKGRADLPEESRAENPQTGGDTPREENPEME